MVVIRTGGEILASDVHARKCVGVSLETLMLVDKQTTAEFACR